MHLTSPTQEENGRMRKRRMQMGTTTWLCRCSNTQFVSLANSLTQTHITQLNLMGKWRHGAIQSHLKQANSQRKRPTKMVVVPTCESSTISSPANSPITTKYSPADNQHTDRTHTHNTTKSTGSLTSVWIFFCNLPNERILKVPWTPLKR